METVIKQNKPKYDLKKMFWEEAADRYRSSKTNIEKINKAIEALNNLPIHVKMDGQNELDRLDMYLHYEKQGLDQAQQDCDKFRGV